MASEPRDRDLADRLDRELDALVRGERGRASSDPELRPVLRLVGRAMRREPALSEATRQRIWHRIEAATQGARVAAGAAREGSPIMAALPRPIGARRVEPERVRRWRPALELAAIALLLLALIGGVLMQRPPRTPTLPGGVSSPQAAPSAPPYPYTLNLTLRVMSRTEPQASSVLLDAERNVVEKRLDALGIRHYQVTEGSNSLLIHLTQVNLPAALVESVLTQTGEFEVIDAQGKYLPLGTEVNTLFGNAPGTNEAGYVFPALASGNDVVGATASTGPNGYPVVVQLNDAAASFLAAYVHSQNGSRLAYVLDNRVAGFGIFPPPSNNNVIPPISIVVPSLPPIASLGAPIPTPPPGTSWIPQNALVAILKSGPLPAPLTLISQSTAISATAQSAVTTPVATPVLQSAATPTGPYEFAMDLRVVAPAGQTVTDSLVQQVAQVLRQRVDKLGIPASIVPTGDEIHLLAGQVSLPPAFIESVLTQTGLFEIISTGGKTLAPGTAVNTTFGSPAGTPITGPVYTSIVTSKAVTSAGPASASDGLPAVTMTLSGPAAQELRQYTSSHPGQPVAFVLDGHVLSTVTITGAGAQVLIEAVNASVLSLNPIIANAAWPAQNALVAMLSSGPLPASLAVDHFSPHQLPAAAPATPTPPAVTRPTIPYSLELIFHVVPPSGQNVTAALLDRELQIIKQRAAALGLTDVTTAKIGGDEIRIRLMQVNLPPGFVAETLSQVGQFEVIDPQGNYLWPGTVVSTTLGPPASGATTGTVYTTLASSKDVVNAITPSSSNPNAYAVVAMLTDAAANNVVQFVSAHRGGYLTYVLDKRVLETILHVPQDKDPNILITAVLPPVNGLQSSIPTPPPGTNFLSQNALVAILTSGPLPGPVGLARITVIPNPSVWSTTPVPTWPIAMPNQVGQQSLNPNGVEIALTVDAAGVTSGDAMAVAQALAELRTKLQAYKAPCRIAMVLTYGAGEVGPGNELASAINNIVKSNFPALGAQSAVYRHFSDNSLDPGTVKLDIYFFEGCPALGATPAANAATQSVPTTRQGQSSIEPNGVEITLDVDPDGVRAGDVAAIQQALTQLRTQLHPFAAPCRVAMVLTYGAGDVGPGNELASAINDILVKNFPNLIEQNQTVLRHFSDNSLDTGQVKVDIYFFQGCPVTGVATPGS